MTQRIKIRKEADDNYASEFSVSLLHANRFKKLCNQLLKSQPVGTELEITVSITYSAPTVSGNQ